MNVVYCTNGHYVGAFNHTPSNWQEVLRAHAENEREDAPHRTKFCAACGAPNVSACEHCETLLRPLTHIGGRPSYCVECAEPIPWTKIALYAAKEHTDELAEPDATDKATLKGSFDDRTVDTARTPLAASRFKKIIAKVGPAAGDVLQKIAVEFVCEAGNPSHHHERAHLTWAAVYALLP